MTMIAPNLEAARLGGLTKYHGKPCSHGHTVRNVSNRACATCGAIKRKRARDTATPEQREAEKARKRQGKKHWRRPDRSAEYAAKAKARQERAAAREASPEYQLGMINKAIHSAMAEQRRIIAVIERQTPPAIEARKEAARLANRARVAARNMRIAKTPAHERATGEELLALKRSQGDKCAYCGRGGPLHLDHKMPLAYGGWHTIDNLQYLCPSCNMHKRTTPDHIYRERHNIGGARLQKALFLAAFAA